MGQTHGWTGRPKSYLIVSLHLSKVLFFLSPEITFQGHESRWMKSAKQESSNMSNDSKYILYFSFEPWNNFPRSWIKVNEKCKIRIIKYVKWFKIYLNKFIKLHMQITLNMNQTQLNLYTIIQIQHKCHLPSLTKIFTQQECPSVFGKWPQPLLRAGLWDEHVQIKVSHTPNLLNYCTIYTAHI